MNKTLIQTRFSKAATTYEQEAVVQRQIAATMTAVLKKYIPAGRVASALEIGCGTGIFSRMLLHEIHPQKALLNDICEKMEFQLADVLTHQVQFLAGDAEYYPFTGKYDLIASCSTLQWFVHPEEFLNRCPLLLNDGGYLAFSTFGQENMKEITALTGSTLRYRSLKSLEEALSGHYKILFSSEEKIIKYFRTPMDVLMHLKRTGVTGISKQVWTKSSLETFCRQYRRLFTASQGLTLTYHPIYILAQKK